MDLVAHVDLVGQPLCHHLHVVVEVRVTADVEVPWHFLHRERPHHPTPMAILKRVPNRVQLFLGVGLPHQLIPPTIQVLPFLVESPFLQRPQVGVMRPYQVIQVERDHLAGVTGELNVQVDPR